MKRCAACPSKPVLTSRSTTSVPHRLTDVTRSAELVRFVPILLQKSAYRRRGTVGAFFEAIHFCHPLDCAGDLRSTLLTLATLTQ